MIWRGLLVLVLVAPSLGLRLESLDPSKWKKDGKKYAHLDPDHIPDKLNQKPRMVSEMTKDCAAMPRGSTAWEESVMWGVFIDGKDVHKGPHVYDWDKNFFYKMSAQLRRIYDAEKTPQGQKELSLSMVEKFREATYENTDYNEACWSTGLFGGVECKNKAGGNQLMPECTDKMNCSDVKALLHNIPKYLYTQTHEKEKGCPRGLRAEIPGKESKQEILKKLISRYNKELESAVTDDAKFEALVTFTRSFAFLHAFENGNGRLRNILLQRELRRLGLACGTMMYNYNKDAFVDGHERYKAKVKEGIEMFKRAVAEQKNPWREADTVKKHEAEFEILSGLEKCASKKKFGSGGTINLQRTATSDSEKDAEGDATS